MRAVAAILLFAGWAGAQTPSFESASVTLGKPTGAYKGGCHGVDSKTSPDGHDVAPPGTCTIADARLSHLILAAWGLNNIQLIQPSAEWIVSGNERFNVEGKAADPQHATESQLLGMLQNLIIERFHLKFHRDSQEKDGFALVVAQGGSKLTDVPGLMPSRKISLAMMAGALSQAGEKPVVDETGISGKYDFKLMWSEMAEPDVAMLLRERMGLELRPRKVTIVPFVIDSAERPKAN